MQFNEFFTYENLDRDRQTSNRVHAHLGALCKSKPYSSNPNSLTILMKFNIKSCQIFTTNL